MLGGKRVLIVEDEVLIAMLAEQMIGELGCVHHATAPTLAKAFELVDAGGFDAALLDVNLTREHSFPVADALAARGIPFAFVSGYGDDAFPADHAHRPLVTKPYSTADLERALAAAFRS